MCDINPISLRLSLYACLLYVDTFMRFRMYVCLCRIVLLPDEKLHDFQIETIVYNPVRVSICEFVKRHLYNGETRRISCRPGAVGSIVIIRHNAAKPEELLLCEVEVYGYPGKTALHSSILREINSTAEITMKNKMKSGWNAVEKNLYERHFLLVVFKYSTTK